MPDLLADSRTPVAAVAAALEGRPRLALDPAMGPDELAAMAQRHRGHPHWTALAQSIAVHPAAGPELLRALAVDERDVGVLHALATSPAAPRDLLDALARSASPAVRDHARLGLLHMDLPDLSPAALAELVRAHPGEGGIDIPVRILVTGAPRVATALLEQLADDDVDAVAAAARTALAARAAG